MNNQIKKLITLLLLLSLVSSQHKDNPEDKIPIISKVYPLPKEPCTKLNFEFIESGCNTIGSLTNT